jgi:hypothetical protein
MFANGRKAPKVSMTHSVAVYHTPIGRVVHMHHVVVLERGKEVSADNRSTRRPENRSAASAR